MKTKVTRHSALLAAGLAISAVSTNAETVKSQPKTISGTITYAGDEAIPKGQIKIFLKDSETQSKSQVSTSKTQLISTGKAKTLAYTFAMPSKTKDYQMQLIEVRLERADGWLLARGSEKVRGGETSTDVMLYKVMY
ncbi:hypothetical protein [Pseudovibrio sp. JE062]|uniref:hypothetical protein n=1 Tax=Pseudovibrio sp. JE062 TaxID=439495 RepID=UPI000186C3AF|nr:hypothetical protein [Pseudovibrio sp. JE062]EEA96930.1 conserved hypothetical protein [Pseudovibrio sp. JE062]